MDGGGDKTTVMVLKVDLQCCSCYKKVKKILCKFPQIRNQVYDEKNNTVTISVVCCDPEKFRDKLCCKGCGVIKSIEIKEPPKKKPRPVAQPPAPKSQPVAPPPAPKPQPVAPPPAPKPQPVVPPPAPKPQPVAQPPALEPVCTMPTPIQEYPQSPPGYCCGQCSEGRTRGPCHQWYGRPVPPPPRDDYYGYCCGQCSEGRTGGPCHQWYGRPVPPPPCYSYYGYHRVCYVSGCDHYFSDENATGCSIM